ncbi:MAG: phage tail protein, partial [Crocinitomicaceae bacterium]|nr:phage tail protein [Crocinitomicaceae bacterium]
LTLSRGFTKDRTLFDWCENTHNTLQVKPCNILISLLDKQQNPVKSWLLFHVIPTSWTGGDLGANNNTVMMESVTFTYQNFILI